MPMLGSFVHAALFYRNSDEYRAGTVPFVELGLDRREPVLVAVPGQKIALIVAALGDRATRVRFLDMSYAGRNPGRIIPWVLHAFLDEYADRAGLPPGRCDDLQLAANELASNAIVHGGGTGELRVWPTDGQVVCEVRDRGMATAPLAGRVPPAPDSLSGRGLALVNYLSDLVRIHTGPHGTAIRAYVDL